MQGGSGNEGKMKDRRREAEKKGEKSERGMNREDIVEFERIYSLFLFNPSCLRLLLISSLSRSLLVITLFRCASAALSWPNDSMFLANTTLLRRSDF